MITRRAVLAASGLSLAVGVRAAAKSPTWTGHDGLLDYAHLFSNGLKAFPAGKAFTLTQGALAGLFAANAMQPRDAGPYHDKSHVLFALRGCELLDVGDAGKVRASVTLRLADPDHRNPRCVIGVWRRTPGKNGDAGLLVVPGSTVPNAPAVAGQVGKAGEVANLLPTGRYLYVVGRHGDYGGAFPRFDGAFRMEKRESSDATEVPVVRSRNDRRFGLDDDVHRWAAFDNLHPGVTPKLSQRAWNDGVRFSSEGCLTVSEGAGGATVPAPGYGPRWMALRRAANLGDGVVDDKSAYHSLVLLTGAEACLAAMALAGKLNPARPDAGLRRLRFGSAGPWVRQLQTQLVSRFGADIVVDGDFGLQTAAVWRDQQPRTRCDLVVSRSSLKPLGLSVPPLGT